MFLAGRCSLDYFFKYIFVHAQRNLRAAPLIHGLAAATAGTSNLSLKGHLRPDG